MISNHFTFYSNIDAEPFPPQPPLGAARDLAKVVAIDDCPHCIDHNFNIPP